MPLPQVYPPCRPMEKKRQRFRDAPTQAKNWLRSPALQASRQRLLGQEPALLSRLSCTSRTATSIRSRRARSGACSSRPDATDCFAAAALDYPTLGSMPGQQLVAAAEGRRSCPPHTEPRPKPPQHIASDGLQVGCRHLAAALIALHIVFDLLALIQTA
jgi:hypothetical protein